VSFLGVCHCAEIPYILKPFYIDDDRLAPDTGYMKTVSRTVRLWTNFAKTGWVSPDVTSNYLRNIFIFHFFNI